MAQFYNIVNENNVPLVLEDGNQIFTSADGQRFQFVLNNGSVNGNQSLVTYPQVQETTEPTLIPHQTFIQTTHNQAFTTGQNVYIINTDDLQQNLIKTNSLSPQFQKDTGINFIRTYTGGVLNNSVNEGVELRWVMPQNQSQRPTLVNIDQGLSGTSSDKVTYTIPINSPRNSNTTEINFIGQRTSPGDQKFKLKSLAPSKPSPRPPIRSAGVKSNQPSPQSLQQQAKKKQLTHPPPLRQLQQPTQMQPVSSPIPKQKQQQQQQQQQPQTTFNPQTPVKQPQLSDSSSEIRQKMVQEKSNELNRIQQGQVTPPREIMKNQDCQSSSEVDSTSPSPSDYDAGLAYLQQIISNPAETIVQHQIKGHVAKMLVVLPTNEQRLITFDVPNEECTVQDLLDQARIPFEGDTTISLVTNKKLNINYIVESERGILGADLPDMPDDKSDTNECISSNYVEQQQEDPKDIPKYVDGKLAVCLTCGIASMDLNRCIRCRAKLPNDVRQIADARQIPTASKRGRGGVRTAGRVVKNKPPKEPECLTLSSDEDEHGNDSLSSTKKLINKNNSNCIQSKNNNVNNDNSGNSNKNCNYLNNSNSSNINNNSGNNNINNFNNSKSNNDNYNSNCNNMNNIVDDEPDLIVDKEPIITNNPVSDNDCDNSIDNSDEMNKCGNAGGGDDDDDDDDDNENNDGSMETGLECRTVRIGSYKYAPLSNVILNRTGLILSVPYLEDQSKTVKVHVKMKNIIKVLIHFSKTMPVLFFYVNTKCAGEIREVLGMQDSKGVYFDSAGKDQTHRRITLLPEKITEESKIVCKTIFFNNQMEELNNKEANDILVRASPKDNSQLQTMMSRKSNSLSTPNTASSTLAAGATGGTGSSASATTPSNGRQNDRIIVHKMAVYPPPPAKGGITINTEDYSCLAEDQFLNDVIIDFYLRYLMLEVISENDRDRTHVFSSYFYKRLTSRHAQTTENPLIQTAAAKRHARVQKWTKNVNIFDKDFIIIPINEHAHWFLAIICFPGLVGTNLPTSESASASSSTTTPSKNPNNIRKKKKNKKELQLQALTIGSTTITPVPTTITIEQDDDSERDEAEGDDDELDNESDEEEEENAEQPAASTSLPKKSVKSPCILIFDSLAGAGRSRVVATLRDYLSCEHVAKLGTEKIFSRDTMKGASPRVPQQSNFTDCGLYLLQYVEHFFKDPIKDFTLPIKSVRNWFEEIVVTRKREELSNLLKKLKEQTVNDNIELPVLQFPTENGKLKPKLETNEKSEEPKSKRGVGGDDSKKKIPTDDNIKITVNNSLSKETTPGDLNNSRTILKIIPCSSSSSNSASSENAPMEIFPTNAKPSGSAAVIRNKRPPTTLREPVTQENQTFAKKHKHI